MIRALIEGQVDPEALAELARGRLRANLPALRKALTSRFRGHHAFLLEQMLAHVVDLESASPRYRSRSSRRWPLSPARLLHALGCRVTLARFPQQLHREGRHRFLSSCGTESRDHAASSLSHRSTNRPFTN
jgi:hypothetical protein